MGGISHKALHTLIGLFDSSKAIPKYVDHSLERHFQSSHI